MAEGLVTVFLEHESPSSKGLPFPTGKDILSPPTSLTKNIPGFFSPDDAWDARPCICSCCTKDGDRLHCHVWVDMKTVGLTQHS